jgi:hypothetical protein
MPIYHETITKTAVSKAALEVVLPPRDLGTLPRRALSFTNTGVLALASAKIQVGPTATGPWFDEDLTGHALLTLGAGASCVYRMDRVDRWVQVQAQGAAGEGQSDLTIYIDALGS